MDMTFDAFAELLSPGYHSERPAHPDRHFGGPEQARENWGRVSGGARASCRLVAVVDERRHGVEGVGLVRRAQGR
jgi:hypothetical protein